MNMMTSVRPDGDRLALNNIGPSNDEARWQTEALRTHDSPRFLVFIHGAGRINISGRMREFEKNHVIFIPAKTLYGIEMGSNAYGHSLSIPAAMRAEWPEECIHMHLEDLAARHEMQSYLEQLGYELSCPDNGAQRAALHYAGLLAVFLMRQIQLQNPTQPSENAATRLAAAYADLIAHDYHHNKGVADYAATLGVTPTHLTRCCKRSSGRSALALLNDRIMYEARMALGNSSRPVQDIAQELGFGSAAYFTRAFTAATGMTPTAFRKTGPVLAA